MSQRNLLAGSLLIWVLAACGDGSSSGAGTGSPGPSASASTPLAVSLAWQGHFVGTVRTANGALFGDGFLTADGTVRLYVGGPYDGSGALQMTSRPLLSSSSARLR